MRQLVHQPGWCRWLRGGASPRASMQGGRLVCVHPSRCVSQRHLEVRQRASRFLWLGYVLSVVGNPPSAAQRP